ncbi:MAG: FkbM family methyltransferase [Bacteriovoracaceae bacterium]
MITTSRRADLIKFSVSFLPTRRLKATYWLTKIFGPHKQFIGDFHHGKLEFNPKDPASKSAFYFGFYEKETTMWFLDQVKNKKVTFLDVGANFGYFSFLAQSFALPGSNIIAFEPDPNTRAWLERNNKMNESDLTIEPLAVSSQKGEVEFLSCSADEQNASWSRIDFNDAPESGVPLNAKKVKVKCISLDEYLAEKSIDQVDVLKIDIEGAEGYAIEGMKNSLKNKVFKTILVEFHNWALPPQHSVPILIKTFLDNGYKAFRLKTSYLTKDKDKDPDTFLLNNNLAPESLVPLNEVLSENEITNWEHFVFKA